MTGPDPTTDGAGRPRERPDLSSAFGVAAVSSLRAGSTNGRHGVARPVAGRADEERDPDGAEPARPEATGPVSAGPVSTGPVSTGPVTTEPTEVDVSEPWKRTGRAEPRRRSTPHRPAVGAPRRLRPGIQLKDRQQIQLLLLAATAAEPASAREFVALVRERSGGAFVLPDSVVHRELHHLQNNRLIRRDPDGSRHYRLTELGQRLLDARRRRWRALVRGVDAVLTTPDEPDEGHRREPVSSRSAPRRRRTASR